MPTPSDDSMLTPTDIPIDEDVRRCPPDESRERHASLEERVAASTRSGAADAIDTSQRDSGDGTQMLTPEPENGPGVRDTLQSDHAAKGDRMEDAGLTPEPCSPTVGSPEAPSESDTRLAHTKSTATVSRGSYGLPSPLYVDYPELAHNRQIGPHSTTSYLRPGSRFRGTQQSDRQVYDVQVELKDVDLEESRLCGYLRIQGLTDDHPTLTTFFEGEIIGPHYLFRTCHASWGSSEKVDLQHWARFPAWRPLAKSASKNPHFTLRDPTSKEHIFMRWKEYFLVPDHKVKQISGASFEGFYYICFDQRDGGVSGIYFHAKSEKYQQLELRWVDDGGRVPAVEFR